MRTRRFAMTRPNSPGKGLLSKLIIAAAFLLIGAGVLWQDISLEALWRFCWPTCPIY